MTNNPDELDVVAYQGSSLPHYVSEVVSKAKQDELAANQRTKEALELMSLGLKSVSQTYYRQAPYTPKFKILQR